MLNNCSFIGRLGKDPESRFTASGDEISSFSIACTEKWKDKQGVKQERTEWVNCTCFGSLAGIASKYLTKGSLVYISGKFKTDKYQNKQGVDVYSTKINVRELKMLGDKSDTHQSYQKQQAQQQVAPQQQTSNDGFNDSFDDDIPF